MLKPTRNKRRIAALTGALALSACLALGLAGCAGNEGDGTGEPAAPATEQEVNADAEAAAEAESGTITFTDDLGRTVELPAQIDKICPSGFTAQQVLLTMAPDKMVGLAQELNDDQLKIFGEKFADYPVFGAVLGAILNFLIIAVAVYFCILVPINKFRDVTEALLAKTKLAEDKKAEEEAAAETTAEEQTVQLLQQIRDELAKQNAAHI